jgi:predicted dehydrogenase
MTERDPAQDPVPGPAPSDPGHDDHGDIVRVGVVGAGGVAQRHVRVLSGLPGVVVAGIADPLEERAVELAATVDAQPFTDPVALVRGGGLDALYVCTPPFARGVPELLAVDHGLPLFVEKPLAADLATAEAVGARVEAAGLPTATGYHWRQLDTVASARKLLAGREAGLVVGRWLDKVPPPAWWSRRDGSGGQLVEQATHLVDLARHLVGDVVQVFAAGTASQHRVGPDGDVDEVAAATLRFAGGAVGTLAATCLLDRAEAAELEVVAPGLVLTVSEAALEIRDADGCRRIEPAVDPRLAVDEEFVEVVRGRRAEATVPYAEALRTHRVACALAASAKEGRPVDMG